MSPSADRTIVAGIQPDVGSQPAAEPIECRGDRGGIAVTEMPESCGGIQFADVEIRRATSNPLRRVGEPPSERIAERVGGIGRDQQHPPRAIAGRDLQRGRRRRRRLANAALAAEQENPRLVVRESRDGLPVRLKPDTTHASEASGSSPTTDAAVVSGFNWTGGCEGTHQLQTD